MNGLRMRGLWRRRGGSRRQRVWCERSVKAAELLQYRDQMFLCDLVFLGRGRLHMQRASRRVWSCVMCG